MKKRVVIDILTNLACSKNIDRFKIETYNSMVYAYIVIQIMQINVTGGKSK